MSNETAVLHDANPYQTPAAADNAEPAKEIRRPAFGTFLVVL